MSERAAGAENDDLNLDSLSTATKNMFELLERLGIDLDSPLAHEAIGQAISTAGQLEGLPPLPGTLSLHEILLGK